MDFEQKKTKEVPENFEQAALALIQEGDEMMREHNDSGNEHQKVYHIVEHPQGMRKYARPMMDILELSAEERGITDSAIAWHDEIIDVDLPDPRAVVGMIARHRGAREGDRPKGDKGNEARSRNDMTEAMKRVNENAGWDIFSEDHMRIVRQAIDATYPEVDFGSDPRGAEFEKDILYERIRERDPAVGDMIDWLNARGITQGPHFFQPHLEGPLYQEAAENNAEIKEKLEELVATLEKKKINTRSYTQEGERMEKEAVIVALTDLGAAGLENPAGFSRWGDMEFRELFHNLRKSETMQRLLTGEEKADKDDRQKASMSMLNWWGSQTGFAMWQMMRFYKIMYLTAESGRIAPEQKEKMKNLFSHYEENIKDAYERSERAKDEYDRIKEQEGERQAFAYLAKEMKYISDFE